jgi:hypothetical protein
MARVQLWSCGGGRQSAGIAALIVEGKLPRPDHACMVKLEGEVGTVWPYVDTHIRPALERLGVPFSVIDRKTYSTRDLYSGADLDTVVIPAYTDQSGKISKFDEFCSVEWKRRTSIRWAAEQPGWKEQGVDVWMGISLDESKRRRAPVRQWIQPVYPLLDVLPVRVSECLEAVRRVGWPEPPRSRCHFCPNQSDSEWSELTPEEWESACAMDEKLREVDPHVFLHKTAQPLRMVSLKVVESQTDLFSGGCSSGTCF